MLLCLGQGVDMGEGGKKMCVCVWDRVWLWEREDGRCFALFGPGCGYGRVKKRDMCLCLGHAGCGYEGGKKGNVLLCLGQGVDMGDGGREMCDSVWDRVWIWGREGGRCASVFGTGCGYGRGRKGDVRLCLGQGVDMGEG